MLLRFKKSEVQVLLDHAKSATSHREPYSSDRNAPPASLLVGDDGIYLMSNGLPTLLADGTTRSASADSKACIVYAEECNPEMMAFDDWWEAKNESFGGDDGVESLEVESVELGMDFDPEYFVIEMDSEQSEFSILYKSTERSGATKD